MLWWALAGWLVGWTINLLADVLPTRARPSLPPRCLECGAPRRRAQLSGLVAYLSGHMRCARCGQPIPLRWPLVELLTPALFAYLAVLLADPLQPPDLLPAVFGLPMSPSLLLAALYTSVLLLICVIDIEHRLILRIVIFPAIVAGAVLSLLTPGLTLVSAILGGLSAFALTGLVYLGGLLFVSVQARRGRALSEVAFGQGDVWLMLFIGLILGFPEALRALVLGVVIGGFAALAILLFGLIRRESALYVPFAYGPYLALAGWIVLVTRR